MSRTLGVDALMRDSGVKFGTSGARGLVTAMTDQVCYAYTTAFLQSLARRGDLRGGAVALAGDLRPSTPRIMGAVAQAIEDHGQRAVWCGTVPSPAVAAYGLKRGIPAIMVTGSHIPDDRNGIKFNKSTGEILKDDERAMQAETVTLPDQFDEQGQLRKHYAPQPLEPAAEREYVARWLQAFPSAVLSGKRIGVYGHSAVGRELLVEILSGLGAEVLRLGWSDRFIPVDTEAIRPADVELAQGWAKEHRLFSIVSTDGDSDRPLIADEHGEWFRGDVSGILCAEFLKADAVVTPVSCNSALELCGRFGKVIRTKIGSPFVIEGMLQAVAAGAQRVVGYEANGGFLQATDLPLPTGFLSALPTRDPVIVMLALLLRAAGQGCPLSTLGAALPQRFTASERLEQFPSERAQNRLKDLQAAGPTAMGTALGPDLGSVTQVNDVDGLRITFASGDVIHVRPSGNAPELRCYAEASTQDRAKELVRTTLKRLELWR